MTGPRATITVTQAHINNGKPGDACRCPVALAISEYCGQEVRVSYNHVSGVHDDALLVRQLPVDAEDFILRFDHGLPVSPFSFELTDW